MRKRPIQWKGAQLAALYKGKGPRYSKASFRDVAIGDPDGKVYGTLLRKFLLKAVTSMNPNLQFGSGCGGGGCDIPHLAAQAALQLSEVRRCCVGLLFVDVSTAFAALVRETILPTTAGKEAWMRSCAPAVILGDSLRK